VIVRLKFYLLRKFVHGSYRGRAYVSKNGGKLYWITAKRDPKRSTKFVTWHNWTLHRNNIVVGTYPFLQEAKFQAQIDYNNVSETPK
jgi:hypothetical protein